MKKDGKSGSKTVTGINCEGEVDLYELLKRILGYSVKKSKERAGVDVYFEDNKLPNALENKSFTGFLTKIK